MTFVLDRVLAAVVLLVSSPLLAMASLGIKAVSPGTVLYRAQRAGMGGTPFTMLKLRTMHAGSASAGRITGGADRRVFALGAVLRKLKIDELPQLINVLRGEMALVGPRPEDIEIVRNHYTPMMWESLTIRPGVTSPGSLHYFADEAVVPSDPAEAEAVYLERLLPRKIALDLVYVRQRSMRYELQILIRTALSVVGLERVFARTMRKERAAADAILQEQA